MPGMPPGPPCGAVLFIAISAGGVPEGAVPFIWSSAGGVPEGVTADAEDPAEAGAGAAAV